MNIWKTKTWAIGLASLAWAAAGIGQEPSEWRAQARAAMERGAQWLAAQQQSDGYWGVPEAPAMTGLALWALQRTDPQTYRAAIDRAMVFVLVNVREDGSIWRTPGVQRRGGGLANYNTAICMTALHALGRPELVPVVLKARTFLANAQYLGDDAYRGGMGYDADTDRAYADLSNSYIAYEAMRLTQDVEDLRREGDPRADLDWDAARQFLDQIQNLSSVNTNAWVSESDADRGGFAYSPGSGASSTNAQGKVTLRSYGSMTYAGLLSLVYADVDEADPRVVSARDWAARHWSLDENPGMGQQGLYYFFNVLSKALRAYGDDVVELPDGSRIDWRAEVVRRLVELQRPDGSWVNENNRWWEADPNLVTSYTLLALAAALE
jgi:squalene-hopene/tetraprenyl-beta-curcumene cyclase